MFQNVAYRPTVYRTGLVVEGFSFLLWNRRGQEKNIGPGKFADMNKCRASTDKNLIRDVEYKNKIDQNWKCL